MGRRDFIAYFPFHSVKLHFFLILATDFHAFHEKNVNVTTGMYYKVSILLKSIERLRGLYISNKDKKNFNIKHSVEFDDRVTSLPRDSNGICAGVERGLIMSRDWGRSGSTITRIVNGKGSQRWPDVFITFTMT